MAEVSRNLRQVRDLRLSNPIRDALDRTRPEFTRAGVKVGLVSFLVAVLDSGGQDTAASVVHSLYAGERSSELRHAANLGTVHDPDAEVAGELNAAFDDAFEVRSRTGGRDDYIGMRHLLFALFTGRTRPVAAARRRLFARTRIEEIRAVVAIVNYCLTHLEIEENLEAWLEILNERKIPAPPAFRAKTPDPAARSQKKKAERPRSKVKRGSAAPAAEGAGLEGNLESPSPTSGDALPPDEEGGLESLGGDTPGVASDPDPLREEGDIGLDLEPELDPDRRPEVPMLQADDPWSSSVEDQSGARSEAEAFAAMVTATAFEPPLAVGVFGDWGSGKSFFMRLLHDAVAERAREAGEDEQSGAGATEGVRFYSKVVQIRFNAWHYAETNLWASLVDHIFVRLDKWAESREQGVEADLLFDRLATARNLTVDAAEELLSLRREHAQATVKRDEAATALVTRRAELESSAATYFRAVWARAADRSGGRAAIDSAIRRLRLTPLLDRAGDTAASLGALKVELARLPPRRRLVMPIAALGMVLAVAAAVAVVAWLQQRSEPPLTTLAAAISAWTLVAAPALLWARRAADRALRALRDFQGAFETELAKGAAGEIEAKTQAERQFQTAEAAAAEAEERLSRAARDAAEAAHDYHANTGKGRALDFVRARLAKGDYAKHLGFIATVRRDFEELSARMKKVPPKETTEARALHKAHVERLIEAAAQEGGLLDAEEVEKLNATLAEPVGQAPVFERIILYIDDLDRCPPHQVVKVLQAIHLLLTFPLFVVFVAVDVRWLRHSLAKQYAGQVKGAEGDPAGATASASDYLEKIFQIPYWVRPIDVDGTSAILESRMGALDLEGGTGGKWAEDDPSGDETNTSAETDADGEADEETDDLVPGAQPGGEPQAPLPPSPPPPPPPPRPTSLSLRLTIDERKFIQASAALLDGSPRRTLRFLNTYRIIKGSLQPREAVRLERGGYRALLTMLSIAVSIDDCYPALLRALGDGQGSPIGILRLAFDLEDYGSADDRARVQRALNLFERQGGVDSDLPFYARLAARYSFNPEVRIVGAAPVDEPPPNPPA